MTWHFMWQRPRLKNHLEAPLKANLGINPGRNAPLIKSNDSFNGDIDQICRSVHGLDRRVDRVCGDMTNRFPVTLDFEMRSNRTMVAIHRFWHNIRNQILGKLHHGSNVADDGTRNLLWIGKVAQALKDFEQNHQSKLWTIAPCSLAHKSDIGRGWGIEFT